MHKSGPCLGVYVYFGFLFSFRFGPFVLPRQFASPAAKGCFECPFFNRPPGLPLPHLMKLKKSVVAGCLLIGAVAGYGQVQSGAYRALLRTLLQHSVPEMGVQQAAQNGEKYFFLDARERREYEVSHLPGARWVGYETFQPAQLEDIDKQTPLVVYCSIGYRSEKVAEQLQRAGFQQVWNLYGGIFEWVNQGYPVYNMREQPTDEVHAYDRKWGMWLKRGKKVYR